MEYILYINLTNSIIWYIPNQLPLQALLKYIPENIYLNTQGTTDHSHNATDALQCNPKWKMDLEANNLV